MEEVLARRSVGPGSAWLTPKLTTISWDPSGVMIEHRFSDKLSVGEFVFLILLTHVVEYAIFNNSWSSKERQTMD